jgi:hypothetical protein
MPILTNQQLQGIAAAQLGPGVELMPGFNDPYPDAPCWGWALFGGPGGLNLNTPPVIFETAFINTGAAIPTLKPGFQEWVANTFPGNDVAAQQAAILVENYEGAAIFHEEESGILCREALARLCVSVSGLTITDEPGNYSIIMASDHWFSWEHWVLRLANNINAPGNPAFQYTQRDADVNPLNTRSASAWGNHPLLTVINIRELHQGHIDYLQHAVGWP